MKGKSFSERYFQCFPDNPGNVFDLYEVKIISIKDLQTGLYFTRDWAYRDIDGDYYVVGRQDDIIRIKGVWIQVPEIESLITVSTES